MHGRQDAHHANAVKVFASRVFAFNFDLPDVRDEMTLGQKEEHVAVMAMTHLTKLASVAPARKGEESSASRVSCFEGSQETGKGDVYHLNVEAFPVPSQHGVVSNASGR